MKKLITLITVSSAILTPLQAAVQKETTVAKTEKATPATQRAQKVEICFVLDTTGSMSGLIEGAKRKIWTIANHIVQDQNAPEVSFSLVAYRDRGDDYITKLTPLTDDLDAIQQELNSFKARGGGDTPESVNQALFEAIQKIKWSDDEKVKKIVFLVGDAPPHMDYPQDVTYSTSCEGAKSKGIVINTIQCGSDSTTTQFWAKIAMQANGQFASIPQNGGTQVVLCPQDQRLAELGQQLNKTVISYGTVKQRVANDAKCRSVHKLSIESQAARSSYNWSQKECKAVTGNNDLLVEYANKRITIDTIKKEHLPSEWQNVSKAKLQAGIAERLTKRSEIQKEINKLAKERNAYLKEQEAKNKDSKKNAFDTKMKAMIDKQLAS